MMLHSIAEWIIGSPLKKDFICTPSKSQTEIDTSEKLIGTEAVTATPLRPSGKIFVGEIEHDAKSDYGFIDKDMKVIIIAKKGFSFVVKQT